MGAHEEDGHTDPLRRGAGVAVRDGLRFDWFRVLVDLRRLGWTRPRLACEIAMPSTTFDGWTSVAVSRYDPSDRPMALWGHVPAPGLGRLPRAARFPVLSSWLLGAGLRSYIPPPFYL